MDRRRKIVFLMLEAARWGRVPPIPHGLGADEVVELARTAKDSVGDWVVPRSCFVSERVPLDGRPMLLDKPPEIELPEPRRRRALLVIAPDEKPQAELQISRPLLKHYASEYEADYIELTEVVSLNHGCANKYLLSQVAKRYEQTLLLDADVIPMPYAGCIYDSVPMGSWGLVDDLINLRQSGGTDWLEREWEQVCLAVRSEVRTLTKAWNSGVVVAPPDAYREYYPPDVPVPALWCVEQHLHTLCLLESGRAVDLPLMWQAGYPWVNFPEAIQTAQFIHLNGCHGPHSVRLNWMRHFAAGRRDIPREMLAVYRDKSFYSPWWVIKRGWGN